MKKCLLSILLLFFSGSLNFSADARLSSGAKEVTDLERSVKSAVKEGARDAAKEVLKDGIEKMQETIKLNSDKENTERKSVNKEDIS